MGQSDRGRRTSELLQLKVRQFQADTCTGLPKNVRNTKLSKIVRLDLIVKLKINQA